MSTVAVPSLNGLATDHLPVSLQTPALSEPLPQLTTETVLVTPGMAAAWLATRYPNRPIRQWRVDDFVAVIRAKQWRLNGEPILLDDSDRLVDGQHRLQAVVQCGVALPLLVVRGVRFADHPTIGQGITRRAPDILKSAGHADTRAITGCLSWLYRYERGKMLSKPTYRAQTVLEVMACYPGVEASVSWGRSVRRLLPGAVGAMCHYVMHQRAPALAKTFFQALRSGTGLTDRDPVYALRERCQAARTRLPKPPGWVYAHWAITCWNALRRERSAPVLLWTPVVDESRFPQVQ